MLVAGSDYNITTLMLTFEPSVDGQQVCGKVPIINDKLANEGIEQFSVRITRTSDPRVRIGSGAETCVSIIDDDGKCHIADVKVCMHADFLEAITTETWVLLKALHVRYMKPSFLTYTGRTKQYSSMKRCDR